jgi:hypothetical protein
LREKKEYLLTYAENIKRAVKNQYGSRVNILEFRLKQAESAYKD